MTGAILGGSSVQQAAKLQMVIMFMITASTTLAAILTTICSLSVIIDGECRIRGDRIFDRSQSWFMIRDTDTLKTIGRVKYALFSRVPFIKTRKPEAAAPEANERSRLLA